MSDKPKQQLLDVYIDESSQNAHRYLVLGALVLSTDEIPTLNQAILNARASDLPNKEIKWTKVSRHKLSAYKRVIDVVFDNPNLAHFHSLYVDTSKLNHAKFNQGSREVGFNKEIYQLAIKVSRLYSGCIFHLYPDQRNTPNTPDELRLILNRGCQKAGDKRDWPFRRCQFRDSKKVHALQLVDILTGAIAFRLNGHDAQAGASPAKCELAAYIFDRAKVRNVMAGTARSGRFTIWPRTLQK